MSVAVPFAGGVTIVTLNGSSSVSFTVTLMSIAVSSTVLALSSHACGSGLDTLQLKVVVTSAFAGSFALTVTLYGDCALALCSIVPLTTPVALSILRPAGKPSAEKVKLSPSTSLKCADTFRDTSSASLLCCASIAVTICGASFTALTVMFTLALLPSSLV